MRANKDLPEANEFLRNEYIVEFNSRFTVNAGQKGSAFITCPAQGSRLDLQRTA